MNIKNVVKYTGLTILLGATISGGLVVASDQSFDHTKEACELTKYLGIEHQIKEIEKVPGWTAWKVYDFNHPSNPDDIKKASDIDNPNYISLPNGRNITSGSIEFDNVKNVIIAKKFKQEDLKKDTVKLEDIEPLEENVIKLK